MYATRRLASRITPLYKLVGVPHPQQVHYTNTPHPAAGSKEQHVDHKEPLSEKRKKEFIEAEKKLTSYLSNKPWSEEEMQKIIRSSKLKLSTHHFKFEDHITVPFAMCVRKKDGSHPSYFASGSGQFDTGAPSIGLAFAHDDPLISNAQGVTWRSRPDGYADILTTPVTIEIQGRVIDRVPVSRVKEWSYAGVPHPAIGHALMQHFVVTLVGELTPEQLEHLGVPAFMRQPSSLLFHNGLNIKGWINSIISQFPEINGRKNDY